MTRAAPRTQKKDPTYSEYRGVPIVDTEKLLSFVDLRGHCEDGEAFQFPLGFELEGLQNPTAALTPEPTATDGDAPACPDFILHSGGVASARAYALTFGDADDPDIATVYYSPPAESAGAKRGGEGQRLDDRSLKLARAGGSA